MGIGVVAGCRAELKGESALAWNPNVVYLSRDLNNKLFMIKVAILLAGFTCSLQSSALATEPPRGSLLELHSCELYAGGCIVSSEETLEGRYMLQAWNFTGGTFAGTDLTGLNVALLQASSENLASSKAKPGQAVAYLPQSATDAQREALLVWVKSQQPGLTRIQTRTVPLKLGAKANSYFVSAGPYLSVATAPLESCDNGSCGEALWYSPRSANSVFSVAVNHSSTAREPLLKLEWKDGGKRSVFLAKFGEPGLARSVYVTTADLCGAKGNLF
jgi:hypothetical protein